MVASFSVDGVEFLRAYAGQGGKPRFGTPKGLNTAFPEFEFYSDLAQPKFYTRSIFLADPGDTPELALQAVGGTYDSPTAVGFAYHLGGFVYALHHDGTATTPQGPLMSGGVDVSGQYPYMGRSGEIAFPNWQIPTQTKRGGGVLFETCPVDTIVSIQRAYYTPDGGHVSLYRAAFEDTGVAYPWNPANYQHHTRSAPGAHNFANTPALGNYTAIMTDRANGAVLAGRRYGDLNTGFALSWENAGNVFNIDRVVSGNKIRAISIFTSSGIIDMGNNVDGGNRAVRITPVTYQVNYLEFRGSAAGAPVEINALGDETNIDLRLRGKGSGVVSFGAFTSSAGGTINGYITIKDAGGNLRKLATIV